MRTFHNLSLLMIYIVRNDAGPAVFSYKNSLVYFDGTYEDDEPRLVFVSSKEGLA